MIDPVELSEQISDSRRDLLGREMYDAFYGQLPGVAQVAVDRTIELEDTVVALGAKLARTEQGLIDGLQILRQGLDDSTIIGQAGWVTEETVEAAVRILACYVPEDRR